MILGAVAIATEIKTKDPIPAGQQLSGAVVSCIKTAVEKKETAFLTASTTYQNGYIAALTAQKAAILAAWDKATKKEVKSALTDAAKAYKTSLGALKQIFKDTQKATKSTYKTDLKACK